MKELNPIIGRMSKQRISYILHLYLYYYETENNNKIGKLIAKHNVIVMLNVVHQQVCYILTELLHDLYNVQK